MVLEIPPIGNLVFFFTVSWLSARVNLNLPPSVLLRISAVALQPSSLPCLMRRMTPFLNLSSHALLSMHGIIWFSVTLLCEGLGGVCVCTGNSSTVCSQNAGSHREAWKGQGKIDLTSKHLVLIDYASFWLALKNPAGASQLGRKHVIDTVVPLGEALSGWSHVHNDCLLLFVLLLSFCLTQCGWILLT